MREAARTLIRFEPLYGSNYRGQSSLHEDAQGAWLRFYSISPYNAYNRFVVDSDHCRLVAAPVRGCSPALELRAD